MGDEVEVKEKDKATAMAAPLARVGETLADFCERYFPDAFVFALCAVIIVFLGGLALGEKPLKLVQTFGEGFWVLIPFTMQMALIIIGGFVVASSPPVVRLIEWLAGVPKTPRGALVGFVALLAMLSSLISWGLSLIFTGLLVREITRRVPRDRLPGHRRRCLSRPRSRLGLGPFVIGSPPPEHQRFHSGGPLAHHRGHPPDPDHLPVAERGLPPSSSLPSRWPWPISLARVPKGPRPQQRWGSPSSRWK